MSLALAGRGNLELVRKLLDCFVPRQGGLLAMTKRRYSRNNNMKNIRNFVIIAHIDHGKSTLADRLLELTATVEKRKMKTQLLDQMELERERGITIKMAPVRMMYHAEALNSKSQSLNNLKTQNSKTEKNLEIRDSRLEIANSEYTLNLIDTPGHSDFSYEVSRALQAVEGAILLVDATQGIQAQTLANLRSAKKAGLKIIGALNKIDLDPTGVDDFALEVADLLDCDPDEVHRVSGKTGEGVEGLLKDIIKKVPSPEPKGGDTPRALIFDSFYDNHKGVVASVRVFDGTFKNEGTAELASKGKSFKIKEVGIFTPQLKKADEVQEGEIGYIATGVKDPELIKIGDTILGGKGEILIGYEEPKPVVFVSFYPEDANEHKELEQALQKLRLNDSSITVDPDSNDILGKGFKVGFLGKLHFEIISERLKREFDIGIVTTFPSVEYKVKKNGEWKSIVNPSDLPNEYEEIQEPYVDIELIMPQRHMNSFFAIQQSFRCKDVHTESAGERTLISMKMPLAELMSDFDDKLKSATEGFASFNYSLGEYETSEIVKVDFLVAGEEVAGLSRFFHKSTYEYEARKMAERLKKLLPRQQFPQAVLAATIGKIIARENIPALKKNVTGHLYGGDRTRKMKLWQKQKKGKKKLQERANVQISPEVFRELLKK